VPITQQYVFFHLIPPLAEQKRIVEKVDELMALCDRLQTSQEMRDNLRQKLRGSAIASLMNAETDEELQKGWAIVRDNWVELSQSPKDVGDLRRSVLQLAVRGKLVTQDPKDKPAVKALERMQYEKIETIQIEGYRTKKKSSLGGDEYEINFPLPQGWTLGQLGDLCIFIDYRGQTPPKVNNGIRLITAKNVRDGFIKTDPEEFINEETYHTWMTRGFPKKGDVLFTTEAPLGKAAVVEIEERFALAQRIINFRPLSGIYGYFLMWLILSPWFQNELQDRATGMTASGIKAAKLKLIHIPLPPLAEQKRIVIKVDELMQMCDRLEESLRQQQQRAEALAASAISHLTI
jgi:type I restriction enzyme, S subunit